MGTLTRSAFSVGAAAALLAGCGGSGESATPSPYQAARPLTQSRTFKYRGNEQSFTVPAGVMRVTVEARGAGGDSCPRTGRGARLYAEIPVTPKERLDIYVGGAGKGPNGGFNGGGGSGHEFGGGGASDVRVSPGRLRDRILVAAGGGGASSTYFDCLYGVPYGEGGGGGGLTGENGVGGWYRYAGPGQGGSGGAQTRGGAGGDGGSGSSRTCYKPGNPGADGTLGRGGSGGEDGGSRSGHYGDDGGGGGGGYFGGGGGGGGCYSAYSSEGSEGGGGGGGSSYAEPRAKNVRFWPNWKNASGDGLVVFSW